MEGPYATSSPPCNYSIALKRMQLSKDILQYARENGVVLNWNKIVGGCLKEGDDSLDLSNKTKIQDILEEIIRVRISNMRFQ